LALTVELILGAVRKIYQNSTGIARRLVLFRFKTYQNTQLSQIQQEKMVNAATLP
jgi:hypothetical protein